jgi:hypothetical protein
MVYRVGREGQANEGQGERFGRMEQTAQSCGGEGRATTLLTGVPLLAVA